MLAQEHNDYGGKAMKCNFCGCTDDRAEKIVVRIGERILPTMNIAQGNKEIELLHMRCGYCGYILEE